MLAIAWTRFHVAQLDSQSYWYWVPTWPQEICVMVVAAFFDTFVVLQVSLLN